MSGSYWEAVRSQGLGVPSDRPLVELTTELTRMLGDADPDTRDAIAYPTLSTWIARGVYDDLLSGLGDGMAAGLIVGLGESGTDTVFRRSFSALVLRECIARDNERPLVPGGKVLEWGDRLVTWLLREQDLRDVVPGKGPAQALAHGADALATLAGSPHLAAPELTVLLDVVADRVLAPVPVAYPQHDADQLARATIAVLRRDTVPFPVVEAWVNRVGATSRTPAIARDNAESFLRALYLQLALGPQPPAVRADLLLVMVDVLRRRNPDLRKG